MKVIKHKDFGNGSVYCLELGDGMLVETTDTHLPYYTRDAVGKHQNNLQDGDLGDRSERWMVGVSVMSGCPVRCKFCATGQMKKWRNLTSREIVDQVLFIIGNIQDFDPNDSKEFKINYTRMGEPFLNIDAVRQAIDTITWMYPNTHHYISTIGVTGSDFSWIKGNVTLQLSLHSLDESHRNWLIPFKGKMSISELGQVRTDSNLKTTLNMTLVKEGDFDIDIIKKYFDNDKFFIKLSPINKNVISDGNNLGGGIITSKNIL